MRRINRKFVSNVTTSLEDCYVNFVDHDCVSRPDSCSNYFLQEAIHRALNLHLENLILYTWPFLEILLKFRGLLQEINGKYVPSKFRDLTQSETTLPDILQIRPSSLLNDRIHRKVPIMSRHSIETVPTTQRYIQRHSMLGAATIEISLTQTVNLG